MSDEPRDPALEVVLDTLHAAVLESMMGCLVGTIVSYDVATRRASVQPSLQRSRLDEDDARIQSPLPIMNDVPVLMWGVGAVRIKFPVNKGDSCLLIQIGMSMDVYKARGGLVADPDDRRHDIRDFIAIPGCFDLSHVNESDTMIEFMADHTVQIGGSNPLVTKAEFDGHTHGPGTFSNSGGSVTGASSGASAVTGTAKLRG